MNSNNYQHITHESIKPFIDNENINKNSKDEWIEIAQNYNDYLDNGMYGDMSFDDYLDDLEEDNSND